MKPPFEISSKLNAVQIRNYSHWLGSIGYRRAESCIAYDPQSYKNIDVLFRLLHLIEPEPERNIWELWLCAQRGTISDFAAHYGSYEENLEDGVVDSRKSYEAYWQSEFPDEFEWYRLTAVEDETSRFRGVFLNNRQVIETDGRREQGQFPHDISAFTDWLADSVRLVIEAVKAGTYHDAVTKLLPF